MKNLKKLNNSQVKNVKTVMELTELFQELASYSYDDMDSYKPKADINEMLQSKGMKFRFLFHETHIAGGYDDVLDYGDFPVIPFLEDRHEETSLDEAEEIDLMDFAYAYRNYIEEMRSEVNVGAWTPVCVSEFLSNEWQEIESENDGPSDKVLNDIFTQHPIREGWKKFDLLDMIWAYDFYVVDKFDEQEYKIMDFFDFIGSEQAEKSFNMAFVA